MSLSFNKTELQFDRVVINNYKETTLEITSTAGYTLTMPEFYWINDSGALKNKYTILPGVTTITVRYYPRSLGTNYSNIKFVSGSTTIKFPLKGKCFSNLQKTLTIHKEEMIPEYIAQIYPLYVQFMEEFINAMENINEISYFSDNSSEYSLYRNIMSLQSLCVVNKIPMEHQILAELLYNDYAANFNFRNVVIDIDNEDLRKFIKNAVFINRNTSSWMMYNLYVSSVATYSILEVEKLIKLKAYYSTDSSITSPPLFAAISDDEIILTELPVYYYDSSGDIQLDATITADPDSYKGTRPFRYQLISKSDMYQNSEFVKDLSRNANPAGFHGELMYAPEERAIEMVIMTFEFPKVIVNIETNSVTVP
jgi:hypothetical protein